MSVSDDQIAFAKDLFAPLGSLSTRKMFGGLGIYCDGIIFALMMRDGTLMVKAKGDLAAELADFGSLQFGHDHEKKKGNMPYWSLPEAALDDPEQACDWAKKSLIQNA
ncbi:MAG: TfoX/Sxy family protein [Planktomarina sp.]